MDGVSDEQNQSESEGVSETPNFRTVRHREKKGRKVLIIILVVLALILIGGGLFYFVGKRSNQSEASPTPTSSLQVMEPNEETPTPTAESISRDEVAVEILNGTGIAGEASYLQGVLKELGYTKIDVGNATSQNYETTEAAFPSSLSDSVVTEITDKLESIYQSVETNTGSSNTVTIITGLRKGATALPKATATPKPTATEEPTTSPSPTVTSSPTPTP